MAKKKRKSNPGKGLSRAGRTKPTSAVCRDCGKSSRVPRAEFYRSSAPRCPACGGLVDLPSPPRVPTSGGPYLRPGAKK